MLNRIGDLAQSSPVSADLAALACAYLLWLAIRLSVIDIREHRLPDRLVLPAIWISAALWSAAFLLDGFDVGGVVRCLGAGLALFTAYLVVRIIHPPGMGFGDVKLAAVIGIYLGAASWWHVLLGTMAAFLLAGLTALVLVVLRRASLQSAIPFGPFMLAGAVLVLAVPA